MQLVQGLNNGRDMAGNKLDGSTAFSIGAAVTPEADPLGPMLAKFEVKVKAGAQFFQTQAIYHPEQFASFMKAVRPFKVKVLAGILVLRNAKMAEFMNANIPGVSVPQEMIDELRAAGLFDNTCKERIIGRDDDELLLIVLVPLKLRNRHQPTSDLVMISASRCVALMAIIWTPSQ